MQTISNVSNTVAGAVRGPTENEGLLIDRADERQHYFLCRGERFRLYLATLVCGTPLATPPPDRSCVHQQHVCLGTTDQCHPGLLHKSLPSRNTPRRPRPDNTSAAEMNDYQSPI